MDDYGNVIGDFYPTTFIKFLIMPDWLFDCLFDDGALDFYGE